MQRPISVSYTHLDVYKRQVYGGSSYRLKQMKISILHIFVQFVKLRRTIAVSYTHIDVYKRQPKERPKGVSDGQQVEIPAPPKYLKDARDTGCLLYTSEDGINKNKTVQKM